VEPRAVLARSTSGSAGAAAYGYARVQAGVATAAAPAGLAIFGLRQNGVVVSEAAVPSAGLLRNGRVYVDSEDMARTGMAMVNPNTEPAAVSFFLTDEAGLDFGSNSMVIEGGGHKAFFLDEQLPAGAGSARTFTFTSSQPVSAIALRAFVNERSELLMTTLPVADLDQTSAQIRVIPHFADGGGWKTQVVLVNPTGAPIAGNLEFFESSGTPARTRAYNIAARSAQILSLDGTAVVIHVGSIRVVPAAAQTAPVTSTIFSFRSQGVTVTESGVQAGRPAVAFALYAEKSNSLSTALALANPGASSVTVNLELIDSAGQPGGLTGAITLPPYGQRALFIHEIPGFERISGTFVGSLRIASASGSAISAIGLRSRYNERGDFLIAATMPFEEGAPSVQEAFIPHFVDGAGYATEFILFNRSPGEPGTGVLRFYSTDGKAMETTLR
jgi:hypothetical protein